MLFINIVFIIINNFKIGKFNIYLNNFKRINSLIKGFYNILK